MESDFLEVHLRLVLFSFDQIRLNQLSYKLLFMYLPSKVNFIVFIIIYSIIVVGFGHINSALEDNQYTMPARSIEEVLNEHTDNLMSIPGVVGTAQGLCNNKPCIKVYVIKITQELEQKIPNSIEGYPVVIEETGEFRALPENQD